MQPVNAGRYPALLAWGARRSDAAPAPEAPQTAIRTVYDRLRLSRAVQVAPSPKPAPKPEAKPVAKPRPAEKAKPKRLTGTTTKDGHKLPDTRGRATTFWNGHYAYKGQRDRENMSIGAWGDPNKPTQYFCALPVGLNGGGKWWHNQKILVTNPKSGKQVVLLVQDKGPHPRTGNQIDLSPVAKEALGVHFMDNLSVQIAFAPEGAKVGPVG